ncbi:MAG TPA: hypothetical protein VK437_16455 [Steroidobacteraceae bacterium]|nr:hypothetical protein [Steroidobacteraceae bacterium]
MNNDTYHEESALEGNFPGREKQDVFPAASREGLTAARKIPFQSRRRRIKQPPFMNKPG